MEDYAESLSTRDLYGAVDLILVMLGTNPYPFTRLLEQVVKYAENSGEKIIVQSGNTPVISDIIEAYDFMPHEKLLDLMKSADVVITQGGFGSLQDCITSAAKVVAVPRIREKGESMDDQTEIVKALAEEGLIIPLYDTGKLPEAIASARALSIKTEVDHTMATHIAQTINQMLGK
ncbi:MAG TPA: glycosyltransferase [Gammaproteobacteria bacterium]